MTVAESIQQAAAWLAAGSRVVVLSGAGISKESGVPTFRDAQEGLWARYDPSELASPQAFRRDPALVWRWYAWRRELVAGAAPNAGHHALVRLAELLPHVAVITQNVDGLHQAAGSRDVLELHGSLWRFKCFDHEHPVASDVLAEDERIPPHCPTCRALVRPDVVWFGEQLDPAILRRAWDEAGRAEVLLAVGTSGVVQPAASLPLVAAEAGARTIEINPDHTPLTPYLDLHLAGPAGVVLPALVAVVEAYVAPA
ncbi:MAG TPA: NAD-dependent deacylase [Ardenticatenaceae bacterium]|nr:NAD-dependent deacylase [Ardenticatenaceae bacterium]